MRHAALWLIPLSVLLGMLLIEGMLRLFPSLLPADAQQNLLWSTQTKVTSIGDPYLGFVYPPFFHAEITSLDYHFTIESDEHGFRNSKAWPDKAEVVIVGDSMAYGYGVEQRDAWPTLVDEALPGIHVVTLAMPGAVPQQYTRYFEKFGAALQPKVLIYTVFAGNDIVEAETFDRWLAAGSPDNYAVWRFFEGMVPSMRSSILESSYLMLVLSSVRKSLRSEFPSTDVSLPNGGRLRLAPNLYSDALRRDHPGDPGFDSVVRAVAEARDRAQALGCQIVVMFVPTKENVYPSPDGAPFPSLIGPLKEAVAGQPGMEVIDLTDSLRSLAATGAQLYFRVDGHPNVAGNRAIAAVVTRYLRENAQALGIQDWNRPIP